MSVSAVLGIDIGGTYTKYGVVDRSGTTFFEGQIQTDHYNTPEEFSKSLANVVSKEIDEHHKNIELLGIGIGAPNGNYYTGNIELAPNLPWKGVIHFAEIMKSSFNLPVVMTNDANAAAQGEMIFGDARGMKNFLMITLGTGLGSGLVVNGGLVYGHDGFAGELGHVTVEEDGRLCGCGNRGCLETYVSATGIKRTLFELLAIETAPSRFRDVSYNQLDSKDITDAADEEDPIAIQAFQKTGFILGKSLADTVAHISPQEIFLFGGLARAGQWIFNPTIASMEKHLLPIFSDKINIRPSALQDKNIAVLGAAALIWNEIE